MNWKEYCQDNSLMIIRNYDTWRDCEGTPFIAITSGGIKTEGMPFPILYVTQNAAWEAFTDKLIFWLKGRKQIHLRTPPEMVTVKFFQDWIDREMTTSTYYSVYCRLTAY